jgi:hypothetical protein
VGCMCGASVACKHSLRRGLFEVVLVTTWHLLPCFLKEYEHWINHKSWQENMSAYKIQVSGIYPGNLWLLWVCNLFKKQCRAHHLTFREGRVGYLKPELLQTHAWPPNLRHQVVSG